MHLPEQNILLRIIERFGGPLGGKAQASANSIECRWNANELAARIWGLGRLAGRIRVHSKDFRSLVGSYRAAHTRNPDKLAVWYFDRPFSIRRTSFTLLVS